VPLTIEATYENGVFVPAQSPGLAEHERVRLVIEPLPQMTVSDAKSVPFQNNQRIHVDPQLEAEIGALPEFPPEEEWARPLNPEGGGSE
jgi:predicted DNA-binding antitoxin AbrB/MazE fold protein